MKIFDSHCHLDDLVFEKDLEALLLRARQAQVQTLMVVGTDGPSSQRAVDVARRCENVFASVGIHPHDARSCNESLLASLRILAADEKVRAWGETGLDFNRMYSPQADQERWFARQLDIGADLRLPMIFHERDSHGRFLQILQTRWKPERKGVVHCFSGSAAELEAYLEMGLYIGITGILTIKTRGRSLRRMVRHIPVQRLLVETDAPYLTPTPERNKYKRNEPAFVRTVLMKLAEVRGEPPEGLAKTIWENSCRLFGLN